MRVTNKAWMVVVSLITFAMAAPAFARPAKPPVAKGHVVVLPPVKIVGKVQRPMAAVEVARVRPVLSRTASGQDLLDRIDGDAAKLGF